MVGGSKIILQAGPAAGPSGAIMHGFDPTNAASYVSHFGSLNPWNPFWFSAPVQRSFILDDILPVSAIKETEFYRDWMAREKEVDAAVGVKLFQGNQQAGYLFVHFDGRRGDRESPAVREIIDRSKAAIAASVDQNALSLRINTAGGADAVLACLEQPAVIVQSERKILTHNDAAERLFKQADTIVAKVRRLHFRDPTVDKLFGGFIERACGVMESDPRAMWRAGGDQNGLTIKATRLMLPHVGNAAYAWMHPPIPCVLLTIVPDRPANLPIHAWSQLFAITPGKPELPIFSSSRPASTRLPMSWCCRPRPFGPM